MKLSIFIAALAALRGAEKVLGNLVAADSGSGFPFSQEKLKLTGLGEVLEMSARAWSLEGINEELQVRFPPPPPRDPGPQYLPHTDT